MRFLGAAASVPIHILAQPELDKLRDGAGEPVSLAVLSGRHSLFVARAVVDRVVNTGVTLGQRVPLHCSATGQVLLSGLDEQHAQEALKAEPLERPTSRTLDKVSAIMKVVRAVKANGYALNDQELEIGLIAVAVPVFDREGSVAAAVSISSLTVRRSAREMVRTFVPQMVTCARNIGERLAPRTE